MFSLKQFISNYTEHKYWNESVYHPPLTAPVTAAYPEEDVLGGVEACGVDPCRVRRVSLADDAAGEAGDGALNRLAVRMTLTTGHRVCHHKVNGILCRTTNL